MEFGLTFKKLSRFCRLNGTCPAVVKMYAQLDKDHLKQPQILDKAVAASNSPCPAVRFLDHPEILPLESHPEKEAAGVRNERPGLYGTRFFP